MIICSVKTPQYLYITKKSKSKFFAFELCLSLLSYFWLSIVLIWTSVYSLPTLPKYKENLRIERLPGKSFSSVTYSVWLLLSAFSLSYKWVRLSSLSRMSGHVVKKTEVAKWKGFILLWSRSNANSQTLSTI